MKNINFILCCIFLLMYTQYAKAQPKIDRSGVKLTKKFTPNVKVMNYGALFNPITKTETVNGVKVTNRFYVDKAKTTTNSKKDPGVPDRKTQGKASTSKENGWECQTQNIKVKLEDDSFMNTYNMAKSVNIFPGAVYTFDNFFNGSFTPEKAPRNSIQVYTSLVTSGDMYENVEDPSSGGLEIKNALNKLKQRTKKNKSNQGFKAKIYECNSAAEMAMAIGAAAQGYGAKVKFDWGTSQKREERYFLVDATQEIFSLSANMPEEGVFKNPEDAKKSGLMFLDNVVYGMRALVSIKTSISADESNLSLGASYSGFGFGAEASLNDISKKLNNQTEVKIYIVGGDNDGQYITTDKNELENAVSTAFGTLTNENAAPLYFTFRNMNNETVRTESATDSFQVQQCIPKAPDGGLKYYNVKISLDNITSNNTGTDKSTIATRVNCDLWVNGERRRLEGQKDNPIPKLKVFPGTNKLLPEIDSKGMLVYETYYTPLAYYGKYDGGCEDDLLKKYGKPHSGSINFGNSYKMDNNPIGSYTIKLTKNELENAKIVVRVPFVTDYNKLNECTETSFSGDANREINLKNILFAAGMTESFSLRVAHKNDISYGFPITVSLVPTEEYAPEPEEEKKLNVIKGKIIKKTLDQNAPAKKMNIKIKK